MKAMANASTAAKRFEGFIPVSEDWHAQVALLGVIGNTSIRRTQLGSTLRYIS